MENMGTHFLITKYGRTNTFFFFRRWSWSIKIHPFPKRTLFFPEKTEVIFDRELRKRLPWEKVKFNQKWVKRLTSCRIPRRILVWDIPRDIKVRAITLVESSLIQMQTWLPQLVGRRFCRRLANSFEVGYHRRTLALAKAHSLKSFGNYW